MNYLGVARLENGQLRMPDGFTAIERGATYEAIDLGGDILLVANPLDRKRIERIESLAAASIADHRRTLEGLAK